VKAQARKSGQTQTENRQGQSEKADCPCEWAKMCNRHLSVGKNKRIIAEFPLFSSFCIHLDSYDNIV